MAQPETPENVCVPGTLDSAEPSFTGETKLSLLSTLIEDTHSGLKKTKKAILFLLTKDANQMALADCSLFSVLHNFPCRKYFMCLLNSFFHGTLLNF